MRDTEAALGHLQGALVCPVCRAPIRVARSVCRCTGCERLYPVRQGIFALVDASVEAGTFYESEEEARFGRDAGGMPEAFTKPVRDFLARLPREAVVVEVGAGRGAFSDSHPGYVASDVSLRALARYCSGTRIQCDAMALPFRDESIDAFFSVAALEHVPDPERALNELDRCLKPGGRMLLYPAWYVRPWASRALAERRYRDLGIWDRVAKATIVVRDRRPYQALRVLPRRLLHAVSVRGGHPIRLPYRRLKPNLHDYLTSDSDAFSSLDPEAVSAFLRSRGYTDLRRVGRWRQLSYGYEPVVMAKIGAE